MIVKVPNGLTGFICKMRQQRATYKTNRAYAGYSVWLLLKTLTTTGTITDLEKQLPKILKLTRLSRATFYRHLNYAKELNLITTKRKYKSKIILTGYKTVINENYLSGKMIEVFYDPKKKILFSKILESLEFTEHKEKMVYGLNKTLSKNPAIRHAFNNHALKLGFRNLEFNTTNLFKMQMNAFQNGGTTTDTEYLFLANPDLNRKLQTIAEARGMNYKNGGFYTIKKLKNAGLIQSIQRDPIQCEYKKDWIGETRGKCKQRFRSFSENLKISFWNLPNEIILRAAANPY